MPIDTSSRKTDSPRDSNDATDAGPTHEQIVAYLMPKRNACSEEARELLDEKLIQSTYNRNYGCKWYFKNPTANAVRMAGMQMNAEIRKASYAAEIPVYCSLQDSPQEVY